MAVDVGGGLGKYRQHQFIQRIIETIVTRDAVGRFQILCDVFDLLFLFSEFGGTELFHLVIATGSSGA
ncbi:MAG TPA: hypothetical protein PKC13_03685 [Blastocatellia bacterium]|nr:hypothetical protein [Blastocatellia bacterium]HNG29193.1 hypothetical protein [Blastocatellia bacterium]